MKTLLIAPALLTSALLFAQPYDYEITPLVGYNIAEGNLNLKDHAILGGEFQLNNIGMPVSPELSILYSNADFDRRRNGSTNIYRIALNGVYEYEKVSFLTPFAKAGLGYETMSEHHQRATGNEDSPFIDAGIGAKIPLADHLALKLEAVYMLKNNDNRWDNNLAVLAGLNIAFGTATSDAEAAARKAAEDKAAAEKAEATRVA